MDRKNALSYIQLDKLTYLTTPKRFVKIFIWWAFALELSSSLTCAHQVIVASITSRVKTTDWVETFSV